MWPFLNKLHNKAFFAPVQQSNLLRYGHYKLYDEKQMHEESSEITLLCLWKK